MVQVERLITMATVSHGMSETWCDECDSMAVTVDKMNPDGTINRVPICPNIDCPVDEVER